MCTQAEMQRIKALAVDHKMNFYYGDNYIRIALDETCTEEDFECDYGYYRKVRLMILPTL